MKTFRFYSIAEVAFAGTTTDIDIIIDADVRYGSPATNTRDPDRYDPGDDLEVDIQTVYLWGSDLKGEKSSCILWHYKPMKGSLRWIMDAKLIPALEEDLCQRIANGEEGE
jgi:hypothetical protein